MAAGGSNFFYFEPNCVLSDQLDEVESEFFDWDNKNEDGEFDKQSDDVESKIEGNQDFQNPADLDQVVESDSESQTKMQSQTRTTETDSETTSATMVQSQSQPEISVHLQPAEAPATITYNCTCKEKCLDNSVKIILVIIDN